MRTDARLLSAIGALVFASVLLHVVLITLL
jgi:hypothetical protein